MQLRVSTSGRLEATRRNEIQQILSSDWRGNLMLKV